MKIIESKNEKIAETQFQLWSVGDILSHDFGEEEWLIESLIPKQGITALSGNPGDFKTWTTIHIALCVARNIAVFNRFKVDQGGVLVVDEEDHIRLLKKRLGSLGAQESDSIFYLSQSGLKVDLPDVRKRILTIVEEKNIKLIILDSLVRVHSQDENDAGGMSKVFKGLQDFIKAGVSILFTHHHRKQQGFGANNPGQSMRGSSDILAAVDCHITVEKKRDEDNKLVFKQSKLRQAEALKPFEVNVLIGTLGPSGFEFVGEFNEKKKKLEESVESIVFLLMDGMKSRQEIIDALKEELGRDTIDSGIKVAEKEKRIEKVPKEMLPVGDRKNYYRIFESPYQEEIISNDLPVS
jgi:hypothetical protein